MTYYCFNWVVYNWVCWRPLLQVSSGEKRLYLVLQVLGIVGTTMTEHISSSDLVGAHQGIKFCTGLQSHNHIISNKPEDCTNSLLLLQPFVFLLHFTPLQNFGNFIFSKFNDSSRKTISKNIVIFFFKSKKSKDSKFPHLSLSLFICSYSADRLI